MKGFIVTAAGNREKSAVKESFQILGIYADWAYPNLEELKEKANYEYELELQMAEKEKALKKKLKLEKDQEGGAKNMLDQT